MSIEKNTRNQSYRDPNTIYISSPNVGSVDKVGLPEGNLVVTCIVDTVKAAAFDLDTLIALDGAGRFVSTAPLKDDVATFHISKADVGRDNAALAFSVHAMSSRHNFVYPLAQSTSRQEAYAAAVKKWLPADSVDVPSIREKLRGLIAEAVKTSYISTSIHDEIKTGNSYQTIALSHGEKTTGRMDRMAYLSDIDFGGKSVLDLGANTGEISRSVRKLGAILVDGYEYDPYFIEIGRAVNALVGATRVSFFQGDCTRPALYEDMCYDIVLALNVWVYIEKTISLIRDIAPLVVFETHTLDNGINYYYDRLEAYFRYSACIGLTDVGDDPHKSRAFLLLANEPGVIEKHLKQQFIDVKPYYRNAFLEKIGVLNSTQVLELASKCFAERSEAHWNDITKLIFGSEFYFEALLAGFYQYIVEKSIVTNENFYLRFFAKGVASGAIDANLKHILDNPKWLSRKIANKFEDMQNIILGHVHRVPPIRLVVQTGGELKFNTVEGVKLACGRIDGHHRLFVAQLMGVERLHCQIVYGSE